MTAILILQLFNAQMVHDLVLARVIANEAHTHASRGEYIDAANEYGEAYTLAGDPTMIYNQAVCWQKMGAFSFAYASIDRYLGYSDMPPEEREQAEKLKEALLRRIDAVVQPRMRIVWSHREHDKRYPHGHKH